MIYTIPTTSHVIDVKWPDRQFMIEHDTVTWTDEGEAISPEDIEVTRFELLKSEMTALIRTAAVRSVSAITVYAIGSSDMRQLYVYALKREEANWLIKTGADLELSNPDTTPERCQEILNNVHMLAVEAPMTGSTVPELAYIVISQYELSQSILNGVIGQIEATRRLTIGAIAAAESYADLDAITEPVWPGITDVTPF